MLRIKYALILTGLLAWHSGEHRCFSDDQHETQPFDKQGVVATFSILGFDPETGEIGGAVQSRVFSVSGVLWAQADVGIVATQAFADVSYGPKGLKHLANDMSPANVVRTILHNDYEQHKSFEPSFGRQFAVMDAKGKYANYTGKNALDWAGHAQGKFVTAQGNILAGEEVVTEMVRAFEETKGHLSL